MHAIEPTHSGHLKVAGFQIGYMTFGDRRRPPVLLLPLWRGVHSEVWKMQVPYLARFCHVVTYDSPGNGDGERTTDPAAYEFDRVVDQGIGLLDHLGLPQTAVVGLARGCWFALDMAARYPARVAQAILISNIVNPSVPFADNPAWWEWRETYREMEKWNYHYCREHYREFLDWHSELLFVEPHSSKGIEDIVGWGLATTTEIVALDSFHPGRFPKTSVSETVANVHCPVLVIHGDENRWMNIEASRRLVAVRPDFEFVVLEGCGHVPNARDAVKINLLLAAFLRQT